MSPGAGLSTDPVPAGRHRGIGLMLTATAIIAVAIGLRLAIGPQLEGLDDAGYLEAAQKVSRGQPLDTMFVLFRTRVGMAYPLGWAIAHSFLLLRNFWLVLIAAELVTLSSIFLATRAIAGPKAAVLALALYGVYPLAVQQSALYLPTTLQVACIAAAVALLVQAMSGAHTRVLCALAGVLLGFGYLVKEDAAILVPAVAVAALASGALTMSEVAWLCAGALAVFASECASYWAATGHPLFRLAATSGLGGPLAEPELHMSEIWKWDAYLRSLFLVPIQVGLLWWLAVPATISAFAASDRALRFLAAAFLLTCAYLQFGSASTSMYLPLAKLPRYTAVATPFAFVLVAAWLSIMAATYRRLAYATVATAIAIALTCIGYLDITGGERMRNVLALAGMTELTGGRSIYSDYYSGRALRLLGPETLTVRTWYHADFLARRMNVVPDDEIPAGSLVLLDHQAAKIYTSSYEMPLPGEVTRNRDDWTVLWTHRAYAESSLTRRLLEAARHLARVRPDLPPSRRIIRNVSDLIDDDAAVLYLKTR